MSRSRTDCCTAGRRAVTSMATSERPVRAGRGARRGEGRVYLCWTLAMAPAPVSHGILPPCRLRRHRHPRRVRTTMATREAPGWAARVPHRAGLRPRIAHLTPRSYGVISRGELSRRLPDVTVGTEVQVTYWFVCVRRVGGPPTCRDHIILIHTQGLVGWGARLHEAWRPHLLGISTSVQP